MKQALLTGFLALAALLWLQPAFPQKPLSADSIDHISKKVADWQLQSWATDGWPHPKYDWTNGAAYAGLLAFARDSRHLACLAARSPGLSR
jgi:hypothetical protein